MLEWSMRKLFPNWLKKPESSKGQAGRDTVRDVQTRDDQTREQKTSLKVEPSLDMALAAPMVPKGGIHNIDLSDPSFRAPTREETTSSPAQTSQNVDEASQNVHIFNFRAWFMADPVKAALTIGLAFLSWLATYTGMLELIQANTGSLDIFSRIAIGFAVLMLMLMILYLLDSLYSGGTPTWIKPLFVFGYLFLTLISVGFGFGFYWKYLEAQTEATRSAESAISQVQDSMVFGQTRLDQLQKSLTHLTALSTTKAEQEREHGNSCPNSSPGEGPRMRLRNADSEKFAYAAQHITGSAGSVKISIDALNVDLKKVVTKAKSTIGADGTRNKFLRSLSRKLNRTIIDFNALRTDAQLREFRESFNKRAGTTRFPNGRGGFFRCPDVQLQSALRGVVRAIDELPEIKNPKISAVEGSEAIIEAFRRLAVTLAALPTLKLPPSPDELRKARKQAISAGRKVEVSNIDAGLSKRDYIPLSAAVFVDLCILLISLNRNYDHLQRIQTSVSRARASKFGSTMLDIFEAHKNKISEEMLEIFHNAEFEYGRDYYLAVPLIKGSKKALINERLHAKREEISRSQHEALDHKVEILESKLQKLTFERSEFDTMKLQLTNHQNRLQGISNQLRGHREQLQVTYQADTPEILITRPEVRDIDGRITKISHDKKRCSDELIKLERLTNGNFQRIEQTKNEIGKLKEQRTNIHRQEEEVLKGQLESYAEYDLAKEARFLSNLCISLEANDILHLASIYPFQYQVRAQLQKHSSRYYAEGRHYRVYRFRKVADTQSQMVLDLIMEASKRARASGELIDTKAQGNVIEGFANTISQNKLEDAQEPARANRNSESDAEIEELRQTVLAIKKDREKERLEFENLKREATVQSSTLIDRSAPVLETVRELSNEERADLNKGLQSLGAASGLGIATGDLDSLMNTGVVDQPAPVSETVSLNKTPRRMQSILGGIFSGQSASQAVNPENRIPDQVIEEQVLKPDSLIDEPRLEIPREPTPVVQSQHIPENDTQGRVNEDSLLPPKEAAQQDQKLAPSISDVSALGENSDKESSERALAHLQQLKGLNSLVQNLDDGQDAVTDDSPLVAQNRTDAHESVNFTDPVILEPGDANQDPSDRLVAYKEDGPMQTGDEPSEADEFEEGQIPGFLKGADGLEAVSEELGAKNWAKRLSPEKKDK